MASVRAITGRDARTAMLQPIAATTASASSSNTAMRQRIENSAASSPGKARLAA